MILCFDVQGWNEHKLRTGESLHVRVDGEDVTTQCFRAIFHQDRIMGDVWLYKTLADGKRYIDPDTRKPAHVIRTGRLSIEPGACLCEDRANYRDES